MGLDEARVRSVLADMQDKLARDPTGALGVAAGANLDEVRTAFLELTKTFHPVRFGRMAIDVQKLANEVFLSLRAAHDTLVKAVRRQSGPIPRPVGPSAPGSGPAGLATRSASGAARPARPLSPNDTGERVAATSTTTPTPPGPRPAVRPASAPGQPTPSTATPARTTATRAAVSAPAASAPVVRDEAGVLDLLQRQQWDQARTALHQLQAREPGSKRFRALMSYARGREAQLDRRLDDARVELQDALDLDPDLQLAKTALTELFTRRK